MTEFNKFNQTLLNVMMREDLVMREFSGLGFLYTIRIHYLHVCLRMYVPRRFIHIKPNIYVHVSTAYYRKLYIKTNKFF